MAFTPSWEAVWSAIILSQIATTVSILPMIHSFDIDSFLEVLLLIIILFIIIILFLKILVLSMVEAFAIGSAHFTAGLVHPY